MSSERKYSKIVRDISWLAFNERVLQEASDPLVPLAERLKFLGIFSNNLDEFFRVRVATLARMSRLDKSELRMVEENPQQIIRDIQHIVIEQQKQFEEIYQHILVELARQKILIVNEKELTASERRYAEVFFDEQIRTHLAPLMIESIPELPLLRDQSIYLACALGNQSNSFMNSYSLIEVPTDQISRFILLPSKTKTHRIILLEDIIRLCLPKLFAQFGFNMFDGYIIKVTRDAELDIDNDIQTNLIESIEKGLKNRKKGRAVRLVYDKQIQKNLLKYMVKLLNLGRKDHLVPGGRIHNFKDFMNFPAHVFEQKAVRKKPFTHPALVQPVRILEVLEKRDILLHFPYHSFDSMIDLLREAAIDPYVEKIQITAYRLARNSKIIHALTNAVRNGKDVTVVLELKARFDEEANLRWKRVLEEEGVHVICSHPNQKIHAKICLITKRVNRNLRYFGFISTGNLNEQTARIYGDHCLLTADQRILQDVKRVFNFISNQRNVQWLKDCKYIITSPWNTRSFFQSRIQAGIKAYQEGKHFSCIIKLNSLTDIDLIRDIYKMAQLGIQVRLIIRGICCAITQHPKWPAPIQAISIVDEYLEHARVICFDINGKQEVYLSSADWMPRNLDFRIETTVPVRDSKLKAEMIRILNLQLEENVKARILDNEQKNRYVQRKESEAPRRSQVEIANFLATMKYLP